MAKKTIVNEVASALGTAVARVETLKAKRGTSTKHAKAKTLAEPEEVEVGIDHHEVARLAYLHWEARGGQGGSAEEDWVAAEKEVRARAGK